MTRPIERFTNRLVPYYDKAFRRTVHIPPYDENSSQIVFVNWLEWMIARGWWQLQFCTAIPNGEYTSKKTAVNARATGRQAGAPDFVFPYHPTEVVMGRALMPEYTTLWFEVKYNGLSLLGKRRYPRVEPEQHCWLTHLNEQPYTLATVVYNWEGARDLVMWYMGVTPEEAGLFPLGDITYPNDAYTAPFPD